MITVLPEGGLCNRLRVVASSWLLAEASEQPMRVLWYRTPDFNARFDSLFSKDALPFEISEKNAWTRAARLSFRAREISARLLGKIVIGAAESDAKTFQFSQSVDICRGRTVFIRTNSRLAFSSGMFNLFKPVFAVEQKLAEMSTRLQQSIGVHVRRSDNAKSISESTITRFIALMNAELMVEPAVQFFVATDGVDILAALRAEFGSRVWEYPKRALSRDDPVAIMDAVIDLYGLGQCKKLIGSYWSSFTDTAAELRGIPCVIAR